MFPSSLVLLLAKLVSSAQASSYCNADADVCLQATLFALVVLLLVIICVSAAPLAGDRGGWFYFYKEDLDTLYLRNLNLVPWNHFIQVGYSWVGFFKPLHVEFGPIIGQNSPDSSSKLDNTTPDMCLLAVQHTNSVRQYASEHGWILAGLKMHRYAKIWVRSRMPLAAGGILLCTEAMLQLCNDSLSASPISFPHLVVQ